MCSKSYLGHWAFAEEYCDIELNQPFRLPCDHYIGPCGRERIFRADTRQCPVDDCDEVLDAEFEWTIDIAALENRSYFLYQMLMFYYILCIKILLTYNAGSQPKTYLSLVC